MHVSELVCKCRKFGLTASTSVSCFCLGVYCRGKEWHWYCLFSDRQSLSTSHLYNYHQFDAVESVHGSFMATRKPIEFHQHLAMQIGRLRKENSDLVRRSLASKGHSLDPSDHKAVHTTAYKQKRCVYCQMNKVKTRSGWKVLTQYRCSQCEVALCTGERNCFYFYHKQFLNIDTDSAKEAV